MSPTSPSDIDPILAAVLASPRYQDIDPGFVRRVAEEELRKRRSIKEAIKATKNKLHQVVGAYLEDRPKYDLWLDALRSAAASDQPAELLEASRQVMAHHASTRERLPVLERFYRETLAGIPAPRSVLDVACGLNPLAIPWMPMAPQAEYLAVDIVGSLMQFLNVYMSFLPVKGIARQLDILSVMVIRNSPAMESMIEFAPAGVFDLALVLKTIPCLEQVDKTAGQRILENVRARHVMVSFPGRSLGGRAKGMVENYEAHFMDLINGKNWPIRRYEFPGELVFLLEKPEFNERQ